MNKFWHWGILLCAAIFLCVAVSCSNIHPEADSAEEERILEVFVSQEAEQYAVVQYLQDESVRLEIEKYLGATIRINRITMVPNTDAISELRFDGVLLTNNPLWIVPLAEQNQLLELKSEELWTDELDSMAGRYQGRQYGYVLPQNNSLNSRPTIVVLPDVLRKAGIREIPYTPEAILEALQTLSIHVSTPLMTYGMPTQGGFSLVLGLFELSPRGGREFYLEDERVTFDKLSKEGEAYLAYVNQLYTRQLIPSDFLSMTEYSAIEMLSSGRCAIAMLQDKRCLREAMALAEQNGRYIAKVSMHGWESNMETGLYNLLVGLISADCTDTMLAKDFFALLHEKFLREDPIFGEDIVLEEYPLFCSEGQPSDAVFDPVEQCNYDVRLFYKKEKLDVSVIEPYYCRIAVGDLPLNAFEDLHAQWVLTEIGVEKIETFADQYTRKYYTQFPNQNIADNYVENEQNSTQY